MQIDASSLAIMENQTKDEIKDGNATDDANQDPEQICEAEQYPYPYNELLKEPSFGR